MPEEKTQKWDKVIHWGLVIMVFLLPLVYSPILISRFVLPKATFLSIITFSLVLLWIIKVNVEGSLSLNSSPLHLPLLFFAAVAILSTLFSVNPSLSFFGSYLRNEGLLTVLSYFLVFLLASNFVDDGNRIARILLALLCSSIIVSILGILQHFNLNWSSIPLPFMYIIQPTGVGQPFSTLGNPVFFGAFLVLVIPIATSFFLTSKRREGMVLYGTILLLAGLALILAKTRGAWIGCLSSLAFYFLLIPKESLWKKRMKLLTIFLAALLSLILLAVVSQSFLQMVTSIWFRAVSIFKVTRSNAIRIELWKNTLKLVARRPILGYGFETFRGVSPPFWSELLIKEPGVADRPHNQLLDIASSMGILGVLGFLWIIFSFFQTGLHYYFARTDEKTCLMLLGVLSATLGYLVQEQFSLSFPGITPILYLLLPLPVWMADRGEQPSRKRVLISNLIELRIGSVFLLTMILFLASFSVRFLVADYFYRNALGEESHGARIAAIENYLQAVALNPTVNGYRKGLADAYLAEAKHTRDQSFSREGLHIYKEAVEYDPLDYYMWVGLGDVYLFQSLYQDAILAYEKALEVNPYHAPAHWALGDTYSQLGQSNRALGEIKKALAITPEHTGALYSLALIYERKGMSDKAKQIYQKVLNLDPHYEKAQEGLERLEK